MKALMTGLIALLASMNSFAGGCEGIDLKNKFIQFVPLNGTTQIMGTLDAEPIESMFPGSTVNPCIAEPNSDNTAFILNFRLTNRRDYQLGEIVGNYGKIQLVEAGRRGATCEIYWSNKGEVKKFKLVARSPKGDLVLSESGTAADDVYGIEAPTMVLRIMNPPSKYKMWK